MAIHHIDLEGIAKCKTRIYFLTSIALYYISLLSGLGNIA